jgi:hypothetical protein
LSPCKRGVAVKQGERLIVVEKDGVLVSEFQLTEDGLAQPEAFVAALKQSIENIEEEEL